MELLVVSAAQVLVTFFKAELSCGVDVNVVV